MILDYETLQLVWWLLIGVLLIGFSATSGMDMGVAMLMNFIGKHEDERRVIVNTVAPHWDGNQVWLITAGGAIFAAWPDVYAAAFSGFYLAMLLVLFALILRPLAFDYRAKIDNPGWRAKWDWALFVGSFVPALIFGVAFGNLLQGVPFHFDEMLRIHYEGSLLTALLPLLNPFAILAGVISVAMLTMHGGVWLELRAENIIAERARKAVIGAGIVTTVLFVLGGIWVASGIDGYRLVESGSSILGKTVVSEPGAWMAIFSAMPITILAPALGIGGPLLTAFLSCKRRPALAFVTSILGLAGIIVTAGVSMFPFIMPSSTDPKSSLMVWDATSSPLTLTVMFWAAAIFVPIVLAYTFWCYWRMWGRVTVADIRERSHSVY